MDNEINMPMLERYSNKMGNKNGIRMGRYFRLIVEIVKYDERNVILNLGSDLNILPKK